MRCYNVRIPRRKAGFFANFPPNSSQVLEVFVMAKTSPEKLAAALRANLKRRKQPAAAQQAGQPAQPPPGPPAKPAKKPPENRG